MLLDKGASGVFNIGGSEVRRATASSSPAPPPPHRPPRLTAHHPTSTLPPTSQVLGRASFGERVVSALNARAGAKPLDKKLITPVTTSNAGQAALRPLDSGLKLDKLSATLPGWKPRTVEQVTPLSPSLSLPAPPPPSSPVPLDPHLRRHLHLLPLELRPSTTGSTARWASRSGSEEGSGGPTRGRRVAVSAPGDRTQGPRLRRAGCAVDPSSVIGHVSQSLRGFGSSEVCSGRRVFRW